MSAGVAVRERPEAVVCGWPPIGQTPKDDQHEERTRSPQASADQALRQLDWYVNYLEGMRKDKLARTLKQNRNLIAKQIGHD